MNANDHIDMLSILVGRTTAQRLIDILARSGEVLGITVVDHIVLGSGSFASFKQLGLL